MSASEVLTVAVALGVVLAVFVFAWTLVGERSAAFVVAALEWVIAIAALLPLFRRRAAAPTIARPDVTGCLTLEHYISAGVPREKVRVFLDDVEIAVARVRHADTQLGFVEVAVARIAGRLAYQTRTGRVRLAVSE